MKRRAGRARVYVRRHTLDTYYVLAGRTRVGVHNGHATVTVCGRDLERVFGVKVPHGKLLTLEISPAKVVKVEELS